MPVYRYEAYSASGTLAKGEISAANEHAAVDALRATGLLPFKTVPLAAATQPHWWQKDIVLGSRIPLKDLALITRELATLVDARVPLAEALRIAGAPSNRKASQQMMLGLRERVQGGLALSEAFEQSGEELPPAYTSMVKAGEAGGNLGPALTDLAGLLERSADITAKIRSAMVYPAVLLATSIAAFMAIVMVLVPNMAPIFEGSSVSPPHVLAMMTRLQESFINAWYLWLLAGTAAIAGLYLAASSSIVRSSMATIALNSPVIGALMRGIESARFCRTLGTLLRSNVPLANALVLTAGSASHPVFRGAIQELAQAVKQGTLLTRAMQDTGVFVETAVRLTAVGEDVGETDRLLLHGAALLEQQNQQRIDRLMSLLVPMLTLAIGVVIGALVLTVMNAILGINSLATQ